jgi:serine/threonine protein kinase
MINTIAVEYHRDNIFHGDIKPENIFFDDEDSE